MGLHETILRQYTLKATPRPPRFQSDEQHNKLRQLHLLREIADAHGGGQEELIDFFRSKCRESIRQNEDIRLLREQFADLQARKPEDIAKDELVNVVIDTAKNVEKLVVEADRRMRDKFLDVMNELTSLRAKIETGIKLVVTAE
jgi:hypothetical protein